MKKMKFIGFLASVIALTGCSLAANQVSLKDFQKLYSENLKNTRMVSTLKLLNHSANKIPSIKNSVRIVKDEIEGKETGAKFVTSDKIEYTYRADGSASATFSNLNTLFITTSTLSISVEKSWIGYSYNEYRDGAGNLFRGDIAQDGEKISIVLTFAPNADGVRFNASLTKLTYDFDAKTGGIKKNPSGREQLVPIISGGEKTSEEDKNTLQAMVETYYTHTESTGIYNTMRDLYNNALDYMESKFEGNHSLEILERNGNYIFRTNEDGNFTEMNVVSSTAESSGSTDTSASSGETSLAQEESLEEGSQTGQVGALDSSKYRLKTVIRRPGGFDGKEIDTITYTNL